MAEGNQLLKYITQRVAAYIDTPQEIRRRNKMMRPREPWQYRWFGMIPLAFRIWLDNRRKRKEMPSKRKETPSSE